MDGNAMSIENGGAPRGEEVRILELGAVLLRRWRRIVLTTLAVMLVAAAAALLRTEKYQASVVLLAPQEQGGNRSSEMLARQLAGAGIPGLGNVGNPNQRLIGVLARSRSFADSMVARVAGPGAKGGKAGELRRMLAETEVNSRPDGSIAVLVKGEDPRLAAKVANTFPALLNEMSARVGVEAAVQKQSFLETQLRRARAALDQSEQRLVNFQKQRNAPELQDQANRTVDAAAQLQTQITEQEVEVSGLRRTVTPSNPRLQAAEARLATLRGQLRRLTAGGGGGLFVPFSESPDLQATLTRLKRDYQRDEQVYISLTTAIAQSQIDVNNNLPVVSVLDQATVPGAPSGIGLKLILLVAAVLGLVLGLVAAFVAEHFARARHDPAAGSFFVAWEDFKHDVVPLRRRPAPTAGRR
jgi:uncharacterized protein involved in exopolysaccharide biosynthesis